MPKNKNKTQKSGASPEAMQAFVELNPDSRTAQEMGYTPTTTTTTTVADFAPTSTSSDSGTSIAQIQADSASNVANIQADAAIQVTNLQGGYSVDVANINAGSATSVAQIESEANQAVAQAYADAQEYAAELELQGEQYTIDKTAEWQLAAENIRQQGQIDLQGVINAGLENVANIQSEAQRDVAEITGQYGYRSTELQTKAEKERSQMELAGGLYGLIGSVFG